MKRFVLFALAASAAAALAQPTPTKEPAKEDDAQVTFKSDVSLVRVDARVVDRNNRAITGLRAKDFVIRDGGKTQPVRQIVTEDMPVDVLLLLDVSVSMRPHVERIASASHEALSVLGKDDRVAIMVFDRASRLRMTFKNDRGEVTREFDRLLKQEGFNGGTDITRALKDAANYMRKSARKEARKAVIIVTDDMTEFDRDEFGVERAFNSADAVLSALLAPDAMNYRSSYPGGGQYPGGGYPGGGGGGWGSIILGGRVPYGGGGRYPGGGSRYPGGGGGYPPQGGQYPGGGGPGMGRGGHTQPAGSAEIAEATGGDSMPVNDAGALETTLERIRQRYSLYFQVPPTAQASQDRTVTVSLASDALRRYPGAEVQYRREYRTPGDWTPRPSDGSEVAQAEPEQQAPAAAADDDAPVLKKSTAASSSASSSPSSSSSSSSSESTAAKRRAVGREYEGPSGPNPNVGAPPKKEQ
jgi:Mg-chelatase subunit ChlD